MKNKLKNNKTMYFIFLINLVILLFFFRMIYNLTFNGMSASFEMNSGPELLVIKEPFDVGLVNKLNYNLVGVTNSLFTSNGPILSGDTKYRIHFEIVGTDKYDSLVDFDLVKIKQIITFKTYIFLIISFAILCVFNVIYAFSLYYDIIGYR